MKVVILTRVPLTQVGRDTTLDTVVVTGGLEWNRGVEVDVVDWVYVWGTGVP